MNKKGWIRFVKSFVAIVMFWGFAIIVFSVHINAGTSIKENNNLILYGTETNFILISAAFASPMKIPDFLDISLNGVYKKQTRRNNRLDNDTLIEPSVCPSKESCLNGIGSKQMLQIQPLQIDPNNPHYFLGMDGQPLMLIGYATDNMMDVQNWQYYIDQLHDNNNNLIYIMGNYGNDQSTMTMFNRVVGSNPTLYGYGNKWDLDDFNSSYFKHMREIISYAESKGVYVSIHIWSSFYLRPGGEYGYPGGIFNPENTITNTAAYGFIDATGDTSIDELSVFTSSLSNPAATGGKTLLQRQQEIFDNIVDATKDYPNIYYEFGTEFTTSSTKWAQYWVNRLHSEAPGKLIVVNIPEGGRPTSGSWSFYTGNTDIFDGVLYHPGYPPYSDNDGTDSLSEKLYSYGKPSWYDTDAIDRDEWVTSQLFLRNVIWPQILSGVYFREYVNKGLINDGTDSVTISYPEDVKTLGYVSGFFNKLNIPFDQMSPNDVIGTNNVKVFSGDCVYVVYSRGNDFQLTLPSGNYSGEWYNPSDGTSNSISNFSWSGGEKKFRRPSKIDWVLYLKSN